MRVKSKVDFGIALILVLMPIATLLTSVKVFVERGGEEGLISLAAFGIIVASYIFLVFPLYYEFERDGLLIRFGLIRYRIPYKDIEHVRSVRSVMGAPALSLERLEIHHGKALPTMISPRDRQEFLKALSARTSHLRLIDGELGRFK